MDYQTTIALGVVCAASLPLAAETAWGASGLSTAVCPPTVPGHDSQSVIRRTGCTSWLHEGMMRPLVAEGGA